jgi:hypothetical protein
MVLIPKFDQQLDRSNGDKWIDIIPMFSESQVLIEYAPSEVPETWDYLGRVFQEVRIGDRWVVSDHERFWPNRPTLITWRNFFTDYRCELRLVRYLKPGRLRVWGVRGELPLLINGTPFTINGVPILI